MVNPEDLFKWFIKQDIQNVQLVSDGGKQALLINNILRDLTHVDDESLLMNIQMFQDTQAISMLL